MPKRTALRLNFTKTALLAINPPDAGRLWVHDAKTAGLSMMLTAKGSRAYYFIRRIAGRPTRVRIGGFDDLTVQAARHEAVKLAGDVVRGMNPQRKRQMQRQRATFGLAWTNYLETHLEPHSTQQAVYNDKRWFRKYLARWENRPMDEIDSSELAAMHTSIAKRSGRIEANRTLQLFARIWAHGARVWRLTVQNPATPIRRYREQSRSRFLNAEELGRLFEAMKDEPDEAVRDAILLLLLTGARKGNLLDMAWTELNLDRGLWTIPGAKSKNQDELAIVLPTAAVAILRRRLEAQENGSPHVFRDHAGRMPGIRNGWDRIRKRAGLEDVTLHDLRRTTAHWQVASGVSLPIVAKALGHRSMRAVGVYARLDSASLRQGVETGAEALLGAAGGQDG